MPRLVNCSPGDAIIAEQYFRAIFEARGVMTPARLAYELVGGDVGREIYDELRGERQIPYVTPVNTSEGVAGDRVWIFDVRTFSTRETVAELANRLDALTPFVGLRSLERITQDAVYGNAATSGRAIAQQEQQREHDEESLTHKLGVILGDVGFVVIALLVIVGAVLAHKAYREYASSK
ncbi:MAG TPA: hypothetical protein VI231_22265 [Candidatus Binatia bacterium]|jgi:hypothetical protein